MIFFVSFIQRHRLNKLVSHGFKCRFFLVRRQKNRIGIDRIDCFADKVLTFEINWWYWLKLTRTEKVSNSIENSRFFRFLVKKSIEIRSIDFQLIEKHIEKIDTYRNSKSRSSFFNYERHSFDFHYNWY